MGTLKLSPGQSHLLLLLSIVLQLIFGLSFGHNYDMRIYLATGYLTGTAQNPYIAQDLSAIFHNNTFQGLTSIGYPPPWSIVLGLLYRSVNLFTTNLIVYNFVIKLPIIAANVGLAYLAARTLKNMGAGAIAARQAWLLLLFNPYLLIFGTAWGQFDSIVALLSLAALIYLEAGRPVISSILLALAISFKPTALPLLPVAIIYLSGKSFRQVVTYCAGSLAGIFLFCIAPFIVFRWDPTPIIQHWNAHFTVGGGMSFMTFFELLKDSYQLPGLWWLLGLIWIPALATGSLALKYMGIDGFKDLLKKGAGLILIFFLTRTWLSEPNLILVLPLIVILTSLGELDRRAVIALCTIPFVYSFFNTSLFQLLFPTFPEAMVNLLKWADEFRTARLVARIISVIPWEIAGWWIVITCMKKSPPAVEEFA